MKQEDWETVFQSMNDPLMILSPDYRIIAANTAILSLSGLKEDQVKGRHCYEIYHDSDRPPDNCPLTRAKMSGTHEYMELDIDSLEKTFLITVSPIFDKNGHMTKAVHIARDITIRKEIEKQLEESKERLHYYFESANIGIAVKRPDREWIRVNKYLCDMLGYTKEEIFKKTWAEMTHPDDLQADREQFNRILAGEINRYEIDKRFFRKDGEIIHTHLTVSCIFRSDGSVDFIITTIEDISDRKKTEMALWESEERFRTMVEQSPLSIQIMDPEGMTIKVNRAWEKLWGVKLEDLKDYNILQDKQLEKIGILQYIKKAFAGEATFIPAAEYNVPETLGKGLKRWVQAQIYPVKDEQGNIRNVVLTHHDITERKKAELDLQEKVKELEEFYEMSVGREIKMIKLKEEIESLKARLARYESHV